MLSDSHTTLLPTHLLAWSTLALESWIEIFIISYPIYILVDTLILQYVWMPNSFCKSALSGLRFTVFFICWIQMSKKHLQLYWSAVPSDTAFFSQNPPIIVLFRTWGKSLVLVDLKSVEKKVDSYSNAWIVLSSFIVFLSFFRRFFLFFRRFFRI